MRAYSIVIAFVNVVFFANVAAASYECPSLFRSSDQTASDVLNGLQVLKTPGYFDAPRVVILIGGVGSGKSHAMVSDLLPMVSSQGRNAKRYLSDSHEINWEALEGWRSRALANFGVPEKADPLENLDILVVDEIRMSMTKYGDAKSTTSNFESQEQAKAIANLVAQRYLRGQSTILIQDGRDYRQVSSSSLIAGMSEKIWRATIESGVSDRILHFHNPVHKPFFVIDFGTQSRRHRP